jgi:glycosyltransferase involved in cell wall biosynthesis
MKILFIFPHMLVPAQSGLYQTGLNIIEGIENAGYKTTIIRIGSPQEKPPKYPEILISPPHAKEENKITSGLVDLKLINISKKIIEDIIEDHDIVSIHGPTRLAYPTFSLAEKYNIPVVINYHGSEVITYKKSPWPSWLKHLAVKAKAGIFVSGRLMQAARQKGISPPLSTVIYPSLSEHFLADLPESRDSYRKIFGWENKKILLCVKRLLPVGGQSTLIQAMPKILENHPDTHLVFCGSGPDLESLSREAEELKVADNIELKGLVPIEDLPGMYSAADLFTLASPRESFGLVTLMALAMGTQVVGTPTYGIKELRSLYPDFVKASDDFTADSMAGLVIEHLSGNQDRIDGKTILDIRDKFTPAAAGKAHLDFYKGLI